MRQELNFWVVGGDMRQEKLAQLLAEDGHSVHTFALERSGAIPGTERAGSLDGVRRADCVVLPLPVAVEGSMLNAPMSASGHPLEEIMTALRPGQFLCGGKVTGAIRALAASHGLELQDYLDREELAVANAVPAALAVWAWNKWFHRFTRRSQAGKVSEEVMLRRTRGLLRDYGVTEATMDSRTVAHKLQAVYDDIGSGVDSTTGGEMTFRAAKERVRHYNRAAVEKALERMKTQGK